jgi:hypothetical protein
MKKKETKLVLAKETVRNLAQGELEKVAAGNEGTDVGSACSCTAYGC